jgi:large subunit ribosomal protein L10
MPITKEKKVKIQEDVASKIKGATSIVFVNFHKLNVADTNEVRRALRSEGVGYTVAKKTLIKRAFAGQNVEGEMPELAGEIALVYGTDPIAPARGIFEFQKKFKDQVSLVGGVFEGKFLNKSEIEGVATIPPLQVLYGQFVNLINSPIQGLVLALNAIAEQKGE